jgi:UDPglucose--hexose-1-phosphate uridylyltransferase
VPELRTDSLTGRTVIVAEERAGRPNDFAEPGPVAGIGAGSSRAERPEVLGLTSRACPFCPGQEHQTPRAALERLDADGRWRIRVVPNRFPMVTLGPDEGPARATTASAVGAHEVIIECRRHAQRTSALSVAELGDVLQTYVERLGHWRRHGRLKFGLVFKNQGAGAGASLAHLHSQLVGLPVMPPGVAAELARASDEFSRHGECPYCRLLAQERVLGERIVMDRDGFVAFCPYASWQPIETWLLPTDHQPAFESPASARNLHRLGGVLHELVARIERVLPETSYNLLLRTAPWIEGVDSWCHWRIEILPRVAAFAGLELATGIHANTLAPEHAASHLRAVEVPSQ